MRPLPLAALTALAATACTVGLPFMPLPDAAPSSSPSGVAGSPVTTGASIGPVDLPPGSETTVCFHVRLDNPAPIYVTHFTTDLAPGSHHLIFYKSTRTDYGDANTDSGVGGAFYPCAPFSQTFSRDERPLLIVEKPHDELTLPDGVAFRLDAHQMVRLEAHYINSTTLPVQGRGTVTLSGIVAGGPNQPIEANLGFWGTTRINVPPMSTGDTGVHFERGYTDTNVFAVTTHQHRFGTRMRIWSGGSSGPPIADTTNWQEPPLYRLDPALHFDGNSGLSYRCEWSNPTALPIRFGESALEEMCFLWLYYYPSHGFDFCVDGSCVVSE